MPLIEEASTEPVSIESRDAKSVPEYEEGFWGPEDEASAFIRMRLPIARHKTDNADSSRGLNSVSKGFNIARFQPACSMDSRLFLWGGFDKEVQQVFKDIKALPRSTSREMDRAQ